MATQTLSPEAHQEIVDRGGKNFKGAMMIAKFNVNPAIQAMKASGLDAKYNEFYAAGLFGRCWRMVLDTGLKLDAAGVKK